MLRTVQVQHLLELARSQSQLGFEARPDLSSETRGQEAGVLNVELVVQPQAQRRRAGQPGSLQASRANRSHDLIDPLRPEPITVAERRSDTPRQFGIAEQLDQHFGLHLLALLPEQRLEVVDGQRDAGQHRPIPQQTGIHVHLV